MSLSRRHQARQLVSSCASSPQPIHRSLAHKSMASSIDTRQRRDGTNPRDVPHDQRSAISVWRVLPTQRRLHA